MRPVISIVGRPNVGKSTLYNRLTRSRDALVDDRPGVTRDRMVGLGRVGGAPYWIIDTGGLENEAGSLQEMLRRQVDAAVQGSDAVIFMLDGRTGPSADDVEIASYLRRCGVPVFPVVNKTEGLGAGLGTAEFHGLGLPESPTAVSARHGDGIHSLMESILSTVAASGPEDDVERSSPHVGIVGRPNVGKSTLVNRLLGEERVVVYDEPGTTRDSIRIPFRHADRDYVLVDTAGVRRRSRIQDKLEQFSVARTLQTIEQVDVVVFVLDAQAGISDQDARLAGLVRDSGRSMVLVINKWDGLEDERRNRVRRDLDRKLPFLEDVDRLFVSAKYGSGLGGLVPAVARAYRSAMADLGTGRLNAVLQRAVEAQPPPMAGRRRSKLKYAHQGGKNPPQVIIHGNLLEKVPESYRRYLSRRVARAFGLTGAPVRIVFKSGENPYARRAPRNSGRRGK